jgi:hypothetical protein
MASRQGLTQSQGRWLRHLERCAARGEAMSVYASRQGLSLGAMYEAARTLRRKGAWPGARPPERRRPLRTTERDAGFVRISTAFPRSDGPSWRARLPNGVVLEGQESVGPELVRLFASL